MEHPVRMFLIVIFRYFGKIYCSYILSFFSRVIVGAPEDDSEQAKVGIEKAGAVYRCQTRMPFRCDQIPFDTSGKLCIFFFVPVQSCLSCAPVLLYIGSCALCTVMQEFPL